MRILISVTTPAFEQWMSGLSCAACHSAHATEADVAKPGRGETTLECATRPMDTLWV